MTELDDMDFNAHEWDDHQDASSANYNFGLGLMLGAASMLIVVAIGIVLYSYIF